MSKATNSAANGFAEIRQLQKEQKSYQEREKELLKQRVDENVQLAKNLKEIVNANDILDFTKVSFDDYFKYASIHSWVKRLSMLLCLLSKNLTFSFSTVMNPFSISFSISKISLLESYPRVGSILSQA